MATAVAGIVRFDIRDGATCARRLSARAEPDSARLRKALGESADARALLFARGVVLMEGGTQLGALREWFGKSPTAQRLGTPDALNLVIFSVDGDPNFGTSSLAPIEEPGAYADVPRRVLGRDAQTRPLAPPA